MGAPTSFATGPSTATASGVSSGSTGWGMTGSIVCQCRRDTSSASTWKLGTERNETCRSTLSSALLERDRTTRWLWAITVEQQVKRLLSFSGILAFIVQDKYWIYTCMHVCCIIFSFRLLSPHPPPPRGGWGGGQLPLEVVPDARESPSKEHP